MFTPRRCKAFGTQDIPADIWEGKNKHLTPFPGDNGILFEKASRDDLFPSDEKT